VASGDLAAWFASHPRWRKPSLGFLVTWIGVAAVIGTLHIADARSQAGLRKVHNISTCSLKAYLVGVRDRQLATSVNASDPTVRTQARGSIPDLNTIIATQVPYPQNFDCSKLLVQIAQGHIA
jgi:hypothetical protein